MELSAEASADHRTGVGKKFARLGKTIIQVRDAKRGKVSFWRTTVFSVEKIARFSDCIGDRELCTAQRRRGRGINLQSHGEINYFSEGGHTALRFGGCFRLARTVVSPHDDGIRRHRRIGADCESGGRKRSE